MFVFDDISTYLSFFGIVAFIVFLGSADPLQAPKRPQIETKSIGYAKLLLGAFIVVLTVFLSFVYFRSTLSSYIQMRSYFSLTKCSDPVLINKGIDSVLTPFIVGQMNIRKDLLRISNDFYNNKQDADTLKILNKALLSGEYYVGKRPFDFVFRSFLADVYSNKWNILNNLEYIKKGEDHFKKILEFAPSRPDITRGLAANLFYQKKYDESFLYFEKTFNLSPELFSRDKKVIESIYTSLIKYFYDQKDQENFIKAADRLKANNYSDSALLDKIIDYLDKNSTWPNVNFK
jgi:tetratricopeptide (TPR) repeat protein